VSLDDRPANGQAHPQALRLGRVEGLEQAVRTLWVQPRTGIAHGDEHAARGTRLSADPQLPRPLVDASHGFDRVEDQVQDHLLQLDAVAVHGRQAPRELGLQRDALPQHFAPGQGDDVEGGLVEVEPILVWGRLLDPSRGSSVKPRGAAKGFLADAKLRKIFGKDKVTMFEMNKHLAQHLK
jgi:hypothetical protein